MRIPLNWYPRINLLRLRGTEFFPPREQDWSACREICIGTKTKTIGDALMVSALPQRLKEKYPRLRITTCVRGYNPEVFAHNPYVDGISYFPRRLYGDDACWGSGHHLQVKEQFFGLEPSLHPKPAIFLTSREKAWAKSQVAQVGGESRRHLPIIILHAWGHTWRHTAGTGFWEELIRRHHLTHRFIQIGLQGHAVVPGIDQAFLFSPARRNVRKTFALTAQVNRFIGINSGPMHVARAFEIPSLILMENGEPEAIFERRRSPYFMHGNSIHGFLYEENRNVYVPGKDLTELLREAEGWLSV